jgi:hypothetical protein
VLGGAVQTRFETNSEFKCFKQISNYFKLWSIRKLLFRSWKMEIKYDFEGLKEMNNFLHRHFLRFGIKIQGILYELKSRNI